MTKKRSKNAKLPYREGTWFAVPLRRGGYAVGRVARHKDYCVLAYFFGPKRESVPTLQEVERLSPDSAIKKAQVGALGLVEGSWPIIGDPSNWEREKWPMPAFIRRNDYSQTACLVEYADDDPLRIVLETKVPYDSPGYETEGLHGAGAAEIVLTHLLS